MSRGKIVYVAHYGSPAIQQGFRFVSGAAVSKIDYIVNVLLRAGFDVELLSVAKSAAKLTLQACEYMPCKGWTIKLRKAFPERSLRAKVLDKRVTRQFLNRNLRGLAPGDTVLCYHAADYIDDIIALKEKQGFRLILEVEEVYSDVNKSESLRKREESIFSAADGFVLCTEVMMRGNEGLANRPYAICSGIYRMAVKVAEKRCDGITHVVYAGTLDPRKGGAAAAVAAGTLLDSGFALHILGGGSNEQVIAIRMAVDEANKQSAGCTITYEGLKTGREFDEFIQSCDIGLSPQNPDAEFNATSFPSKVFMYLSNGLSVVSVDLPVFTGLMRDLLHLVPTNSAADLAIGIRSAALDSSSLKSPSTVLGQLDFEFSSQLCAMLAEEQ